MFWTIDVMAYYLLDAGMAQAEAVPTLACAWRISRGAEDYASEPNAATPYVRLGSYAIPQSWRSWVPGDSRALLIADASDLVSGLRRTLMMGPELYGNLATVPNYIMEAARVGVERPVAGYPPGAIPATFYGAPRPEAMPPFINVPFNGME